jgi:hypothetical protein
VKKESARRASSDHSAAETEPTFPSEARSELVEDGLAHDRPAALRALSFSASE